MTVISLWDTEVMFHQESQEVVLPSYVDLGPTERRILRSENRIHSVHKTQPKRNFLYVKHNRNSIKLTLRNLVYRGLTTINAITWETTTMNL